MFFFVCCFFVADFVKKKRKKIVDSIWITCPNCPFMIIVFIMIAVIVHFYLVGEYHVNEQQSGFGVVLFFVWVFCQLAVLLISYRELNSSRRSETCAQLALNVVK